MQFTSPVTGTADIIWVTAHFQQPSTCHFFLVHTTNGHKYSVTNFHYAQASFNQIQQSTTQLSYGADGHILLTTATHPNLDCVREDTTAEQRLANRVDYLQWLNTQPKATIRLYNNEGLQSNNQYGRFISWEVEYAYGNISRTPGKKAIHFHEAGVYMIGYNFSINPKSNHCHGWIKLESTLPSHSGHREASFSYSNHTNTSGQVIVKVNVGDKARLELYAGELVMDLNPRNFWATKL